MTDYQVTESALQITHFHLQAKIYLYLLSQKLPVLNVYFYKYFLTAM